MSQKKAKQARKKAGPAPQATTRQNPPPEVPILTPRYIRDLQEAVEILKRPRPEPLYKVIVPNPDGKPHWENEADEFERSVKFEMTEAHFMKLELDKMGFDNLIEGDSTPAPEYATIFVDPLGEIQDHPKWKTGADLIIELSEDPNIFQGDFAGNRWQGSGAKWCKCPVTREDCPDRQGVSSYGELPTCAQCSEKLVSSQTHYHVIHMNLPDKLCDKCWAKGPLPEEDQETMFRFLIDPAYQ